MILDRILAHTRIEVERRRAELPLEDVRARARDTVAPRDFAAPLCRNTAGLPAVIAEIKKASPSKGVIRADFDPPAIARAYEAGGAAAISVLTDEPFFQGSLGYLGLVKQTVGLPVLRKDFIVDEYQVYESRAADADAVLLIVAALETPLLARLMDHVGGLGMQALVEVHDEQEAERALAVGAGLIGINNRNLNTFEVSLETTERLAAKLRGSAASAVPERTIVSESGISAREDLKRLGGLGVDAVLIGETLMRERDIESKLRSLIA